MNKKLAYCFCGISSIFIVGCNAGGQPQHSSSQTLVSATNVKEVNRAIRGYAGIRKFGLQSSDDQTRMDLTYTFEGKNVSKHVIIKGDEQQIIDIPNNATMVRVKATSISSGGSRVVVNQLLNDMETRNFCTYATVGANMMYELKDGDC
jgi:hypothetical protein